VGNGARGTMGAEGVKALAPGVRASRADGWLFPVLFAMLLAHEMDAVAQHEWRLLYVLRSLPDPVAQNAFVLLHVPLVAFLAWAGWHANAAVRTAARVGVAAFTVVHAGLHWRLSGDPLYTFHEPASVFLIYGGIVPAIALMVSMSRPTAT
jgi:hypothetical protein